MALSLRLDISNNIVVALHSITTVENQQPTVNNHAGTDNLDAEIHVPGSVNHVDLVILPRRAKRGAF